MAAEIDALFARARRLSEAGDSQGAKQAYLALLTKSPGHFGGLNNLGALLHDMGYRSAARTAYAQAVACHPQIPIGHVNLANALRDDGALAAARAHCETALALEPSLPGAHQAMASVLAELHEPAAAAHHRKLGYDNQPPLTLPYRGKGKPISLLLLVSAVGGNVPIRHLVDDTIFRTTVIYADHWHGALPPHDLVFNAIGDCDLCPSAMDAAARLLTQTDKPVVNRPAATLRTGRAENARRFSDLPGVRVAQTIDLPRETVALPSAPAALAGYGLAFPLLLRSPGFHAGQHFERVETAGALSGAVARLPGETLTAIEFLDARGTDGHSRKCRAMFIDGEILPLHLCISSDWKVHYFTSAMAENAQLRAEEERFLQDMPAFVGTRGMAALAAIRDRLGLDYGGIDFAMGADGDILLFEANATMVILTPDADARWDYRRPAIARVEERVQTMLRRRAMAQSPRAA